MNAWFRDPLLVKEFRTRLRARTALIVEELYVCALGAVALLTMLGGGFDQPAWEAGSSLFTTLAYSQAVLLLFVAPLVAASAVSGEKEQKTYDSLMVTPVSPLRVALAKLASVMAVFVILMAVSLPFAAAAYLLGGVSPRALAVGWAYTLVLTGAAGAMGLYWSTRFERSIASIPAAAVCAVLLGVIGPVFMDGGPLVLGAASPVVVLKNVFDGGMTRLFGAAVPAWPLVFALLGAAAAGLTAATVQRLRFEADRRYLWMRAFGWLTWMLLVAGLLGDAAGEGAAESVQAARKVWGQTVATVLGGLAVLAPWIGANLPVIRSERRHARRGAMARLAARLLTGPVGFPLLLAAGACALLAAVRRAVGPLNLPVAAAVSGLLCVLVTPAMLGLLAFRLADRRTVRARFIGFALACVLTFVLTVGPWIVYMASGAGEGGKPEWAQWVGLLSPFTAVAALSMPHEWATTVPRVVAVLGNAGPWAVAPAFALALLALLALPLYPSGARGLAAGRGEHGMG